MFKLYDNWNVSKEDDIFFLRKYQDYVTDSENFPITFKFENFLNPNINEYLPEDMIKYKSENIDFEIMVKVMVWVHKALIPDGNAVPCRPFNSINILQQTKTHQIGSNCWMYAVVLNEIFLSLGFKSRMIRCLPLDLRFNDCHCITEAYSKEYNKWIIFDSAFCTCYLNSDLKPIGLKEFRELIISNNNVVASLVPRIRSNELVNYWVKNLFRFESYSESKFNIESIDEDKTIYSLLPKDYEITNKIIQKKGHKLIYIYTHDPNKFWLGDI